MKRRPVFLWLVVPTLALVTLAEAAQTAVNSEHPLLTVESIDSAASVYFIRPSAGFRGVAGKAVSIQVAGEELVKLAKAQYTLVRLKPWAGELVVKSWTVAGTNNAMTKVKESRPFTFVAGEQYFILISEVSRPLRMGSSFPPVPIDREQAVKAASGLTPIGDAVYAPLTK